MSECPDVVHHSLARRSQSSLTVFPSSWCLGTNSGIGLDACLTPHLICPFLLMAPLSSCNHTPPWFHSLHNLHPVQPLPSFACSPLLLWLPSCLPPHPPQSSLLLSTLRAPVNSQTMSLFCSQPSMAPTSRRAKPVFSPIIHWKVYVLFPSLFARHLCCPLDAPRSLSSIGYSMSRSSLDSPYVCPH